MDATKRDDRISLVIPAYNEAAVIAQAIREAQQALEEQFEEFEILVVDDGSSDNTAAIVEGLLPLYSQTRLIRHSTNRGYGAALRTGFQSARFGLVAFTDADCQFDLTDLTPLARLAGLFSVAVGYRFNRKDTLRRRFFSWGYNRLARVFLGTRVRDVDCALKVFQKETLSQLLPESQGFFVNTEMMTRARQLRIPVAEFPVFHRRRAGGESKVSLKEIPRTAAVLLSYWWVNIVMASRKLDPTPVVFQGRVSVPERAVERIQEPAAFP